MTLKVLIVDDEALARSRLRTLLGECSEPRADVVGEAANAVQAMELIQRTGCDLVMLDIHMPGVDGMALAKTLRELAAPPAVVFITAYAEHAVQAFELEAVDYLTKPVRRERLQQAVRVDPRAVGQHLIGLHRKGRGGAQDHARRDQSHQRQRQGKRGAHPPHSAGWAAGVCRRAPAAKR